MENGKVSETVFAGGCFWCTEAVFRRLKGVSGVIPGYIGGHIKNPAYREVCSGRTGHAEAVRVTYRPDEITFEELLEVFFATHDPTTLNRQGNDVGTQYRSAVFCKDAEQKQKTTEYIRTLEKERVYEGSIVTEVREYEPFYPAEAEHLDYYDRNTEQPYCRVIINPKLQKLRENHHDKLKQKTDNHGI